MERFHVSRRVRGFFEAIPLCRPFSYLRGSCRCSEIGRRGSFVEFLARIPTRGLTFLLERLRHRHRHFAATSGDDVMTHEENVRFFRDILARVTLEKLVVRLLCIA